MLGKRFGPARMLPILMFMAASLSYQNRPTTLAAFSHWHTRAGGHVKSPVMSPRIVASKGPHCSVPDFLDPLGCVYLQSSVLNKKTSVECTHAQHPRERIITTHSHTGCLWFGNLMHHQHFIVDKVITFFIKFW